MEPSSGARLAMVIVLVAVVAGCAPTTSFPPTTLAPTSPGADASPTNPPATIRVPPASQVPISVAEANWARITSVHQPELGDPDVDVSMGAIAARATDAVAVGSDTVCCTDEFGPRAWYSADGIAWTLIDIGGQDATYLDVAAGPRGYAVVGFTGEVDAPRAAAWWSPDGRSWTAATLPAAEGVRVTTVEATPQGYLAIALVESEERGGVSVWMSIDGRTWAQLSGNDALGVGGHAAGIAQGGTGLVIVGALFRQGWEAATWSSADGREWTLNPAPEHADGAEMWRVVWFDDRFVAVGNSPDSRGAIASNPAAWVSLDGHTWSAATVPGGEAEGRAVFLNALTMGGRGVVAVGPSPEGTVGVWVTSDGQDWLRLPDAGDLAAPTADLIGAFAPSDIAAMGQRLIVVGSFPPDAAVWISPPG